MKERLKIQCVNFTLDQTECADTRQKIIDEKMKKKNFWCISKIK